MLFVAESDGFSPGAPSFLQQGKLTDGLGITTSKKVNYNWCKDVG